MVFSRSMMYLTCKDGHIAEETRWNAWEEWPCVEHATTAGLCVKEGAGIFAKPGCTLEISRDCRVILGKDSRLFLLGNFSLWGHDHVHVDDGADLILGKGYMNLFGMIEVAERVEIGDAIIGPGCYITDSDRHRIFDSNGNRLNPPAPVKFCGHVWLGQNVTVLKGVTIGTGSCVGAKSLVCDDIPEKCLAIGSPARVSKTGISWR